MQHKRFKNERQTHLQQNCKRKRKKNILTVYLVCAINADTMAKETIEQFLARGGQIKIIKSCDDRYASHTSRWHYPTIDNQPTFQKSKQAKKYLRQAEHPAPRSPMSVRPHRVTDNIVS